MSGETLQEIIEYYRSQGAPQDQQMVIALLREAQEEAGGLLEEDVVQTVAGALGMKKTMLQAIIRCVPGLRAASAPHRLEVCGTCRKGAQLRLEIEKTFGVQHGAVSEAAGFSYRVTPCMKNCKQGPSIRWDGELYGQADMALIKRLTGKKK